MEQHFGFQGLHQAGWLVVSLLALSISSVLIWVLYRYERQLVERRVGWMLLGLRFAVLFVILFVFLQPVLSWSVKREQQGRVAVAIDLSESMRTKDEHASLAEKLRWARALGMIGGRRSADELDRWISEAEQGQEPEWVTADEEPDPERRAHLADSRRENIEELAKSLDDLSRLDLSERLLTGTDTPLLSELQELTQVELEVFAGKAEAVNPELLSATIAQPPQLVESQTSNLSAALQQASADLESSQLLGIVVLTDGRDNSQNDPLTQSIRLKLMNIPVYPVMIGSEYRPKDLSVSSLEYPQTAFKNDKVILKAVINTSGFEGDSIDVKLRREGKEPETRTIVADGHSSIAEFELDTSGTGRYEYSLYIPEKEGETRNDNNEKTFAMTVVDDTVHVLLVEGEARWEFRFIDNAFTRDERVDVEKVVFEQPYLGVLEDTFFPRRLSLPPAGDIADSPFTDKDLVILGDVSPEHLPPEFFRLLDQFVSEAGGTLVIIAGKNDMPLSYNNPTLDTLLPVRDLAPVDITGPAGIGSPEERGFHLTMSLEGEGEPFLQFSADPIANRQIWQSLPGFNWGLLGNAKPGATVLAYAANPGGAPELEDLRRNAVIVHQYYGFGQVLWVGVDSTWRWRYRNGDRFHHRFWGQLGRWAARNRSSAGNEFIRFGPVRTDIPEGEDSTIKARFSQPYRQQFPNATAKTEVYRLGDADEEELFATVEMVPNPARPLSFEGRAVSLPAGRYRLKLLVANADQRAGNLEAPLYVHEQTTLELSDLSANRELLMQMANLSEGEFFLPDQIPELIKKISDPLQDRTLREEVDLWDHWWILLVIFALLTTEWVTRKLNGLP